MPSLKKENADLNKIAYSAKSYYSGLLLTGDAYGDYLENVKTCAKGEVKVLGENKKDNTFEVICENVGCEYGEYDRIR